MATTSSSIDRLRQFGQMGIDEYDRSGLGGLESDLITQGGRRSLADIGRIGADAGQLSDRAFSSAAGIAERQRRALGVTASPEQRASMNRRMGLARILGNVDARNRAFQADQQRRGVIRTDSFSLRDIIDRQIYSNLEGAANLEGGVARSDAASRANRAANTANTFGQTAGLFMSAFSGGR